MPLINRKSLFILPILLTPVLVWFVVLSTFRPKATTANLHTQNQSSAEEPVKTLTPTRGTVKVKQPGERILLSLPVQNFQTFNNCGPATLSMMLAYFGITKTQQELGQKLRPWQNPQGDNDDKSVTVSELAEEAKNYTFIPYYRPNGDIRKLKLFLANDLPVLTRTWLKEGEDIGHYRVVRGFDEATEEIIQNDSLQGANLRYKYDKFLRLWQGFNYEYLVLVPPEKKEIAEAILGSETDEKVAWQNALEKAKAEAKQDPSNPYFLFNQSVAYTKLGQYKNATDMFEKVEKKLPSRMLWYQIDPIIAYQRQSKYERVFTMTNAILNNQNRAFSELYLIRGESYKDLGQKELARQEFQKAVYYNQNMSAAQQALSSI